MISFILSFPLRQGGDQHDYLHYTYGGQTQRRTETFLRLHSKYKTAEKEWSGLMPHTGHFSCLYLDLLLLRVKSIKETYI